ncbi:MAG: hypothetical protein J6Q44_02775 [Alphaproteobacteria bacterium]|nr:hypothetical protein [Alphaproteobacteria bacterium]
MAKNYCEKYFYPEKYNTYKCEQNGQRVCPCECHAANWCSRKLSLDNKEFAMLDSLRAVKEQNLKILEQNKKIIEELALQQLQKLK